MTSFSVSLTLYAPLFVHYVHFYQKDLVFDFERILRYFKASNMKNKTIPKQKDPLSASFGTIRLPLLGFVSLFSENFYCLQRVLILIHMCKIASQKLKLV